MTREPDFASSARFARSLLQAIHDVRHEQSGDAQVVHFWDTHSLFLPVRGATSLPTGKRTEAQMGNTLVEALFAAGLLGQVALLRPHKAEFLGIVSGWEVGRRVDPQTLEAAIADLLAHNSVDEVLAISELLSGPDGASAGSLEDAARRLADIDRNGFVFLQAAAGTWRQRLRHLTSENLLSLQSFGPPMSFVRHTPEFGQIIETLAGMRRVDRPYSNAVDAASLASLIHLREQAQRGESRLFARFFTSARTMMDLYANSKWLRKLLSFPSDTHTPPEAATLWRDHSYYFVRALFPALHRPVEGFSLTDKPGPGLDELEVLVRELRDSLSDDTLATLVQRRVFTGPDGDLGDLIESLQQYRMTRIWWNYEGEGLPPQLAAAVENLHRLRQEEDLVDDWETKVEHQINFELREARVTRRTVDRVDRAVSHLAYAKDVREISIKHDLAGPRWGIELEGERDIVRGGAGHDAAAFASLLSDFTPEEVRDDPDKLLRSVGILLGIEAFDLAKDLLDLVPIHESEHLRLLAHAALLGAPAPLTEQDLAATVRTLRGSWESVADTDQAPSLALGHAWAVFMAWQRSASGGAWMQTAPQDDLGWARWSIRVVLQMYPRLTSLGKINAVNHLVYVSACSGVPVPEYDRLRADLDFLADRRGDWHFLDTIGFAALREGQQLAESNHPDRAEIRRLFDRAIERFDQARRMFPTDREVTSHRELAVKARNALDRDAG